MQPTQPNTPDVADGNAPEPIQLDDLRELLLLVAALCNAILLAKADGKINLADLKFMLPVLRRIKPALQEMDNAWDALRDMSEGQAERLSELFCLEIGVPVSELTTELMASALRISGDLSTIVRHISAIKNNNTILNND